MNRNEETAAPKSPKFGEILKRMGKFISTLLTMLAVQLLGGTSFGQFSNPLFIPDTLLGPVLNMSLDEHEKQFFPGQVTQTKAFNNQAFLGPTLVLRRGWEVQVSLNNNLADTTTLHWHGIHLSAHADGGPHSPILPNAQWNPHFTCLDKAGTYWYHPHFHGKTGKHTLQGAAGMIIVRDMEEGLLALPRRYGTDDFPVIVQCQEFDETNQIKYKGSQDSILLVNGTISPFLNVPAQVVRLRLLNSSNARNFNFGLPSNQTFYLIGTDGGLLGETLPVTRVKLAPGERAEILVNLQGLEGQIIRFKSYGSEIPQGTHGGPTLIGPTGSPNQYSPLNGINFDVLEFRVGAQTANPILTIPGTLVAQTRLTEDQAINQRNIVFSAATQGSISGPYYMNDSTFNMERIDFRIPVNCIEIWNIQNQTVVAHPFHVHGFQFYILDRYGAPVGPEELGRKDMILLSPNEQARIIIRFSDFADSLMPYMHHCHILTHEDEGMMGQFVVIPTPTGKAEPVSGKSLIFPNPVRDYLTISKLPFSMNSRVLILNSQSRKVREIRLTEDSSGLYIGDLDAGIYILKMEENTFFRFVKEN